MERIKEAKSGIETNYNWSLKGKLFIKIIAFLEPLRAQ